MYKDYRIVVVTPSGRSGYQSILFEHLKKHRHIIDEYRIWQNTTNTNDINFLLQLNESYDWVSIDSRKKVGGTRHIGQYFDRCCEDNTIYIRLDDDIVYLDNNFFTNLIEFRINNPDYFLVFGNIVNNDICNHFHHRFGAFKYDGHIPYGCAANAWQNPQLAEDIHRQFIVNLKNNKIQSYYFDRYILYEHPRFSINAICWFGTDMYYVHKYLGGIVHDEEQDITVTKTQLIKKYNCICGSALCSHFSFFTQREYLDKTNILDFYKELI